MYKYAVYSGLIHTHTYKDSCIVSQYIWIALSIFFLLLSKIPRSQFIIKSQSQCILYLVNASKTNLSRGDDGANCELKYEQSRQSDTGRAQSDTSEACVRRNPLICRPPALKCHYFYRQIQFSCNAVYAEIYFSSGTQTNIYTRYIATKSHVKDV